MRWALPFVVATLVTLALLELGTRVLLPLRSYEEWRRSSLRYTYEPEFHWRLRPGEYRAPHGTLRINARGLRGDEIARRKAPDVIRVLCLGGSSVFNYHAREAWPQRLGDYLRGALGRDVEVINAATPGYSLYQSSVRYQRELVSLDPDLVLVYHLWNDLKLFWIEDVEGIVARWDAHGRFNETSTLLDPFPFLDAAGAHSQFVTHARFAALGLLKRWRSVDHEGWIHSVLDKRVTPQGLQFYRANLERIADVSASRGIPLAIIDQALLATPESTRRQRRKIRYDYTGFDHPRLLEAIEQGLAVNRDVATRARTWHVSVDGFPRNLGYMRDHVHLTDAGLGRLVQIVGPQVATILWATQGRADG